MPKLPIILFVYNNQLLLHTHTHTHMYIYVWKYTYICVYIYRISKTKTPYCSYVVLMLFKKKKRNLREINYKKSYGLLRYFLYVKN